MREAGRPSCSRIPRAVCLLILAAFAFAADSLANPGELRLDGNFIQGGLVTGHAAPGTRVWFEGAEVRVSNDGVFIVGFGRDAPAMMHLQIIFADGSLIKKTLNIEKRSYDIQRIDGLPKRKVTPEPSDLEQIHREAALVRAARQRDDPRTDFLEGFHWPARGRISGVYGSQRILNGEPRTPHYGVDVTGPVGGLVRAPASGIVTLARPAMYYSGGTLILDHGHGVSSSFLHLSEILVDEGQRVHQGAIIGRIGATGRVTGPHLDWRVNWFDTRIDPALLARDVPKD